MLCMYMLIPSVATRTVIHSDKLKNVTNKWKWKSKTNVHVTGMEGKGTEDQDTGQKKANNKTKDLSSNITTILNMWMV